MISLKNEVNFLNQLRLIKQNTFAFQPKYSKKALKKLKKDLKKWETSVKRAVGEQLDSYYINKHLPRPNHYKLFPYRNTGKQQNSIKATINNYFLNGKLAKIESWVEIGVPYAIYTNQALPRRKSGIIPKWKGWVDDIIYNDGRANIISVSDIFKEFSSEVFI